jgi:hypothetical protein
MVLTTNVGRMLNVTDQVITVGIQRRLADSRTNIGDEINSDDAPTLGYLAHLPVSEIPLIVHEHPAASVGHGYRRLAGSRGF